MLEIRFIARVVVAAVLLLASRAIAAEPAGDVAEAVTRAADAYVTAFNARDYAALSAQWAEKAELVEGNARVSGRERIVASIRGWLERHPEGKLALEISAIEPLAAPLVRVSGRMKFTKKPGAPTAESRFTSLRVLDGGQWRLLESLVEPSDDVALDDLDWLVGTWRLSDPDGGTVVEAVFERTLGGHVLVGRTTITRKGGTPTEAMQVIHPDRGTGSVRTWVFDANGAWAEGVVEFDGTSYHQSLVGVPAATAVGREARWVQVISPTGADRFTLHAIERTVDGVPLPDAPPLHFRKVR